MDSEKRVVFQKSDTQRVTCEPKDGNVQINKEWRKNVLMDWCVSKGILIPKESIPELVGELIKNI